MAAPDVKSTLMLSRIKHARTVTSALSSGMAAHVSGNRSIASNYKTFVEKMKEAAGNESCADLQTAMYVLSTATDNVEKVRGEVLVSGAACRSGGSMQHATPFLHVSSVVGTKISYSKCSRSTRSAATGLPRCVWRYASAPRNATALDGAHSPLAQRMVADRDATLAAHAAAEKKKADMVSQGKAGGPDFEKASRDVISHLQRVENVDFMVSPAPRHCTPVYSAPTHACVPLCPSSKRTRSSLSCSACVT